MVGPDGVAPSRIVGVSASDIFPCTTKSRSSLLAPAYPAGPRKRAVKQLWCGVGEIAVKSADFYSRLFPRQSFEGTETVQITPLMRN